MVDSVLSRFLTLRRCESASYQYDYENRMVGAADLGAGDRNWDYEYDYRSRRERIIEHDGPLSSTTKIVFSGGTSAQEYKVNGSKSTLDVEYVRGSDFGGGIGGILYSLRSGTPSFSHNDRRGDIVARTDSSGGLTYRATYQALGKRTQEVGTDADRQRANSKDEDPTGFLNEGMRYRDLETGVFTTRDPAGFVDGPNLYAYVVQNPWTKFDPEGLEASDGFLDWGHDFAFGVGDFAHDAASSAVGFAHQMFTDPGVTLENSAHSIAAGVSHAVAEASDVVHTVGSVAAHSGWSETASIMGGDSSVA